ncbi:hypothetical protein FRB90_008316 [Tulasnella sp. 427]|nr:hypothetical protein FRB90_008316 [Tulasnella sp. 427]
MPRLFVSHRQQPTPQHQSVHQQHRQSSRARIPSATSSQSSQSPPSLSIPIPHQPPIMTPPATVAPRAPLPATNDEGLPLILVPPVPSTLAKLMDSHDLDNPYLCAAFNVLIENSNNPMRVPDILQAVMKKGWTQVLHRHKDRPEQLFGNALRSHQRRRELVDRPSLVFMIDAGSCWKHHQIDLSGASGRKKGKIWCFSQAAGFPCPYTRLGMDLDVIVRAQEGPGALSGAVAKKAAAVAAAAAVADASDDDDDEVRQPTNRKSNAEQPSRKKRKIAPAAAASKMDPALQARFEEAVRGGVASAHSVASMELPSYIPAATIPNSQEVPYGATRTSRNASTAQPKRAALPVEIVPRPATQANTRLQPRRTSANNTHKATLLQQHQQEEIDLDALTAMSPEPSMMMMTEEEEQAAADALAEQEEMLADEIPEGTAMPLSDAELFNIHAAASLTLPADWLAPLPVAVSTPLVELPTESGYSSNDDEDDFHVTMQHFNPESSPVKVEQDTEMLPSTASSPGEDHDSSEGSVVRTPTPPPSLQNDIATWSLATAQMGAFDSFPSDAPFHASAGLGFDFGGWDFPGGNQVTISKGEMEDQGWSRAGTPFGARFDGAFLTVPKDSMLTAEPMELDLAPSPASFAEGDSMSVGSSFRSRAGTPWSHAGASSRPPSRPVSRCGSVRSTLSRKSSRSSIIIAKNTVPLSDREVDPRRMSTMSSTSTPNSPRPVILYSPALTPSSVDADGPLKHGLAHRYLTVAGDEDFDNDMDDEDVDVDELEGLLNLDGVEEDASVAASAKALMVPPATANVVSTNPVRPVPIRMKRPRSPSL